jgi:hypothetical protein
MSRRRAPGVALTLVRERTYARYVISGRGSRAGRSDLLEVRCVTVTGRVTVRTPALGAQRYAGGALPGGHLGYPDLRSAPALSFRPRVPRRSRH